MSSFKKKEINLLEIDPLNYTLNVVMKGNVWRFHCFGSNFYLKSLEPIPALISVLSTFPINLSVFI